MFKKDDLLLKIVEKEKITLFGVSAKYIDALRKLKPKLKYKYKLNKLRNIKRRRYGSNENNGANHINIV